MKQKLAAIVILALSIAGFARSESLVEGSLEDGKNNAVTCGACHGADGNSVNPAWPSIAGQNAPYLVRQLHAFKDGERSDVLMSGQAMSLDDEGIRNLAVYFESQVPAAKAISDPSLLDKGRALYTGGNRERAASACIACHGPTGSGNPAAAYPAISGQYAAYTAKQLRDFASDVRKTDGPTKVMRDIAKTLSEDDIIAVSSYIQGLH